MKKIINPCCCEVFTRTNTKRFENAFAEIVYENGNLSIHGVVAPLSNGDCLGSRGQCVDEIRNGTPTEDFDKTTLAKFCDIWEKYHLNDMKPYCSHQRELGWDKLAKEEVKIYNYTLSSKIISEQNRLKQYIINCAKEDKQYSLTPIEKEILNLKYSISSPTEIDNEYYASPKFRTPIETKRLGWLKETEHPKGILCKSCPICGYKYGTTWLKEEVPEEVIEWLFNLPQSKIKPAWI